MVAALISGLSTIGRPVIGKVTHAPIVAMSVPVFAPQGKVIGTSSENGCQLLGLASPGITPTIVTLNVTLTGCSYVGYNRTYNGSLSVFTKERYAKFSLQALDVSSGNAGTYNITATMQR